MLSSDLVRVSIKNGHIFPRLIKTHQPKLLKLARALIQAFQEHVGLTYGELDEALKDIEGNNPKFQIIRGLAHLLHKRSEWKVVSPIDPMELRRKVFALSASYYPVARQPNLFQTRTRDQVLEEVAQELQCSVQDIEEGLYADLFEARRLIQFDPLTPEELLNRYNLSLVQGILLKAVQLTVDLNFKGPTESAEYRQLFRYLKFYQLLHTIVTKPSGGFRLHIDGPISVLKFSGKYGLKMANFFPALALHQGWFLQAKVLWKKQTLMFKLSHKDGLKSHYAFKGVYLTQEEQNFMQRFSKLKTPWQISRENLILPLGGQSLLIPDFKLEHREDGRIAYLEIVGYWRSDYMKRRLTLLKEKAPSHFILALSLHLKMDPEELEELPIEVIFFKKILMTKAVIAAAEKVAVLPQSLDPSTTL